MKPKFIFMAMGILLVLCAYSYAQVPALINYQGKLTTTSGAPVNDTLQMVFSIHDLAVGGTTLWTETQSAVIIEKGVFNVLLGSVNPIPYSVFDGSTRYLGVQVGGDPEITPRKKIVSVAYSYKSLEADTADYARAGAGGGADNDWVFPQSAGGTNPRPYLYTYGPWGIARYSNTLYGDYDSTHVNLGVACTTGISGWSSGYCTVGGGLQNTAYDRATVGGGWKNTASGASATVGGGYGNTASGDSATVGGGSNNIASGFVATVGGGWGNTSSHYATIGGGYYNTASGLAATVGGGASNRADSDYATVGGGVSNSASGYMATIGGGRFNTASGITSTIAGGDTNAASGDRATIGGGWWNTASGGGATVAGGYENTASEYYATVAGGLGNNASNWCAIVGGGESNTANGQCATVGGGRHNTASGDTATVGGGSDNIASDYGTTVGGGWRNTASNLNATVAGGLSNTASGGDATVGGGGCNTASGGSATVPGGSSDTAAGDYSFAAGRQVRVDSLADYTFAFGNNFTTSASHAVILHDSDTPIKVGIGTTSPQRALHISDVLRLEPRATAPASPSEGDIYVNSTDHHMYCYLNGVWRQLD